MWVADKRKLWESRGSSGVVVYVRGLWFCYNGQGGYDLCEAPNSFLLKKKIKISDGTSPQGT
jgi:hypothetical protein